MLLVCGGASQAKNPPDVDGFVCYSPVLVIVDEDDAVGLENAKACVLDPFVVRLSDKDVIKLINSEAAKRAVKRES